MTQGTIIPPAVDQDSIEYGHVYANYVKSVADTPGDPDANPDIVHVNGQVTFDSTFPGASARGSIRLPASPRAYGLIVTGDTFEIVNSKLVDHEGREGVRLIASVDGIPLSWQAVVTLQDSSGRTIYNKSYIIHHDLWDSSGELLHINLPDLIPTPSRLEPPEGAAVRVAERALEEIRALTGSNEQINLDIEGLKSEVVTLHGQTGQRLTAAEAAKTAAETARNAAQTARTGAESARTGAESARTGAESARTGAESARDTANNHRVAAQTAHTGAEGARDAADGSAVAAGQSATSAGQSATSAGQSASDAAGSATGADAARAAAVVERTGAETARTGAETAQAGAETARTGAESARDTANNHRVAAQTARTGAQDARDAAEGYASDASSSASAAAGSASGAASSATAAGGSETAAGQSATDAASSATAAEGHASGAATALSGAESARDLAQQAEQGAADERVVAQDAAVLAEGHAQAADGHRVDAEAAAATAQAYRWVPRGEYVSGTAYEAGDVVLYSDGSYYAQAATDAAPPAAPWVVLASGSGGITHWSELDGVPDTFPAEAHTHDAGDVHGAATPSLDVREASVGALSVEESLSAKSDADHTHAKADVGLGNVDNTSDANKPVSTATQAALNLKVDKTDPRLSDARTPTSHTHTKGEVGLGNVDNTSDANKPVSTATQAALDGKSASGHTHTKGEVGLGNVDNTSDANKPVSTAVQTALNGKAATGHKHPVGDLTASGTASSSTYLRGDGSWATPANTTYAVPSQAEAEAGTATTGRAFSAQRVRQAINAHPRVAAAPATWHWAGTSLPTAASQVHAQARVGDFIVAPNLDTDPGWHQITGV